MTGVVTWDATKFRERYPDIKATEAQLEGFFIEACMLLNNTEKSCVRGLAEREVLLHLLVAHLGVLQAQTESGNSAVGRISSASEGSVSASFDNGQSTQADKWYQQTPYGARYWALTAKYRSFLYVSANTAMRVRR